MTQTALYSDKKLFLSLYKSALRRIRGMGIIYGLLSFIAFPMFFVMEAVEEMHRMQLNEMYSMRYFNGVPAIYTNASMILYFALIVAGTVIISVYVNSYMHSKKAVDVFHALPAKRSQMLMANFAATLTVLLGTQFICYGIVLAVNEVTIDQLTTLIVLETLRVALLTTLVAAITFFCCVCCNTSLDSAIFSAAFLAIVPSYTVLICLLMEEYVMGFNNSSEVLYTALKFSPAAMFYQVFSDGNITQGPLLNAIYIAVIAVLMVVSCILYTNRKSEMAQSASTKNPLYQFILLAASVGGGALFGFGYQGIFGWGIESIAVVIFTSCIFTVAIYLVFNAIVSRNPKPTKRGLAGLGISLAVTVAFLLCVDNGFFGYEKRIPAMEDIQSVSVNYAGDYSEISNVEVRSRNNGKDIYYYYNYNSNGYVAFTNPEEVAMVRDIHSTIVDSIDQDGIECYYGNTYITYTLKNGKQLVRRYRDDVPMAIRRQLAQLEDLESFKKQLYPVFKADADTVKAFDIKDGYGRNEQRIHLDEQGMEKLYDAIAQDTLNVTRQMKDQHSGPVLARIEIIYKDDGETVAEYLNSRAGAEPKNGEVMIPQVEAATAPYYNIEKEDVNPLFHNVIFDVTEGCINTIAALKELGYEEYTTLTIPEDMVAYVQYLYYPMDGSHNDIYWQTNKYFNQIAFYDNMRWNENERTEEFSDPQQLSELSAASRTVLYGAGQDKEFYMVLFCEKGTDFKYTESEDAQFMAYYISGEDIPDFVQFENLDRDWVERVGYIKE